MVSEEFTGTVAAKLAELNGEKPTVSTADLVDALEPDGAGFQVSAAEVEEALDSLVAASVAVQVGTNAERGRMWRHSGMDEAEAHQALAAERERIARETEAEEAASAEADEEAARERALEIERERGIADEGAGELGADDEAVLLPPPGRMSPHAVSPAGPQRVELPMALVGKLSNESVAELVSAGVAQAREAGVGFEFIVTP